MNEQIIQGNYSTATQGSNSTATQGRESIAIQGDCSEAVQGKDSVAIQGNDSTATQGECSVRFIRYWDSDEARWRGYVAEVFEEGKGTLTSGAVRLDPGKAYRFENGQFVEVSQ